MANQGAGASGHSQQQTTPQISIHVHNGTQVAGRISQGQSHLVSTETQNSTSIGINNTVEEDTDDVNNNEIVVVPRTPTLKKPNEMDSRCERGEGINSITTTDNMTQLKRPHAEHRDLNLSDVKRPCSNITLLEELVRCIIALSGDSKILLRDNTEHLTTSGIHRQSDADPVRSYPFPKQSKVEYARAQQYASDEALPGTSDHLSIRHSNALAGGGGDISIEEKPTSSNKNNNNESGYERTASFPVASFPAMDRILKEAVPTASHSSESEYFDLSEELQRTDCSFVRGHPTGNIPLGGGLFGGSFSDLVNSNASQPMDTSPSYLAQSSNGPFTRNPVDIPDLQRGGTYQMRPGSTFVIGSGGQTSRQTTPASQPPAMSRANNPPRGWRMANVISADHKRHLTDLYLNRELDRQSNNYQRQLRNVEADGIVSDLVSDPPGQQSLYIPPGDNRRETYRLSTFEQFPNKIINAATLARHGFTYTGFYDRVKCFSCGRTVEKWEAMDDPSDRKWHKTDCSFVRGHPTGNIPLGGGLFGGSFSDLVNSNASQPMDTSPSYLAQSSNGPFTRNPVDIPDLQRGGTYQMRPGSTFVIGSGGQTSRQTTPASQPPAMSRANNPPRGWRMANVISADHKRHLTNLYLNREFDRLASFARWPTGRPNVSPGSLARAGFFYLGDTDRTQCFSCGGVLRNWNMEHDAMGEHRMHFPNCRFVVGVERRNVPISERPETPQELAERYPCRVPMNPHMRSEASRLQTFDRRWPMNKTRAKPEEIAEAGFFFLGERDRVKRWYCNGGLQEELHKRRERVDKEMQSEAVKVVTTMGYEESVVRRTLMDQLESGNPHDADNIFDAVVSLLDAVLKKEQEIRQEEYEARVTSIKYPSVSSNYSGLTVGSMDTNGPSSGQASGVFNVSGFDSDDEERDLYSSIKEGSSVGGMSVCAGGGATNGPTSVGRDSRARPHIWDDVPDDPESMKEFIEQKKEERLCKICFRDGGHGIHTMLAHVLLQNMH